MRIALYFFILSSTFLSGLIFANDVTIPLHESFTYQLDGVNRRGFLDENGDQLPDVEAMAASSISFTPDELGDGFPFDGRGYEHRTYFDEPSGLRIKYEKLFYDHYPVGETLVWFENVSEHASSRLKDVKIFDTVLPTGGSARLTTGAGEDPDPKRNYGLTTISLSPGETRTYSPREAYSSFGAFPYFVVEGSTRSYLIAIGWTGEWSATFECEANGDVRVSVGQKTVDLYLKPGEKFRTPRFTLFEFSTGTDYVNLWRDWYRRYIMPRSNYQVLRPIFALDAYYHGELYEKITSDDQIAAIKELRSLGYPCEALWVDAGWYLRSSSQPIETSIGQWFAVGDWTPDPSRFPEGFRPVADELGNVSPGERKGKLVLWYEPERVHRSKLTDELKKYIIPDREIIESYRMNMASSETVKYLSETIGSSLRTNGVSIYRQDSNGAGPGPFIESLEANDPEYRDRKGYAENLYVRGLYEFLEALRATTPDLIFDSCASGGRRNDLEALRHGAVPLHYTDVGYFDFVSKQHMHDTLNRWFIYYKNIDAHDFDFANSTYDVYKTTIDMAPFTTVRPYFLSHPTPENRNYVDRYFAVRDLLVDGDYYLLHGDFTERDWTVWQFDDSRSLNSQGFPVSYASDTVERYVTNISCKTDGRQIGCIFCVRNELNEEETLKIRVKKLDPNSNYEVENLDTHDKFVVSGKELSDGFPVSLPKRSGTVLKYQKQE